MSKLVCVKCNHSESIPVHCGKEMHQEGTQLVCWMGKGCGFEDIPEHCGEVMRVET